MAAASILRAVQNVMVLLKITQAAVCASPPAVKQCLLSEKNKNETGE
jgi:hypothetical protein